MITKPDTLIDSLNWFKKWHEMGKEIERKFLVHADLWATIEKPTPNEILQGYLSHTAGSTIRIRIKNKQGFITIKGPTKGITRSEFEYPIPEKDAREMLLLFCDKYIQKRRYAIRHEGQLWEVDEFETPRTGLLLAEIELDSETQNFSLPPWIAKEVSDDPQYFNVNMLQ
jgi:adenylate cyclase